MKIILGTTSPYRREAFQFLGIPFEVDASDVDESKVERGNPETLVTLLSRMKAEAVAEKHDDALIIGMDSVAYFGGIILEKPKSREEGRARLRLLSGQTHRFYTGITMINTVSERVVQKVVTTEVSFRELSDEEIGKYLDEDPNYQTYATGYDPMANRSCTFVTRINGSSNNVLRGIPLEVMYGMIEDAQ